MGVSFSLFYFCFWCIYNSMKGGVRKCKRSFRRRLVLLSVLVPYSTANRRKFSEKPAPEISLTLAITLQPTEIGT